MSERAAPFHCPYCGDENLSPSASEHGAWECAACARVFQLKFLGLLARGLSGTGPRTEPSTRPEGSTQ